MSDHTATPQFEVPGIRILRESARRLTGYWWVLLGVGIAWVAVSLVILAFCQMGFRRLEGKFAERL